MIHFVSPFSSKNFELKSTQITLLPSAQFLMMALTFSFAMRRALAGPSPRGKIGRSSVLASGCFWAMTSSTRRTPFAMSSTDSRLLVPIISMTHFAL